ncbi:tyrosyl-DNA phosphodiesterase I [Dichotomocladium elegans]|nr:tyrosyl-DNA phosphodiesterase I [Dichotomocladium elegans]
MVDLDYLMSALHPRVAEHIPVTIIHGHRDDAPIRAQAREWPNVRLVTPRLLSKWGTHHTKAMVLFFNRNGVKTARVVVSTANLCRGDWEEMTQGVYLSPMCPLKQDKKQGESNIGTIIGAEYGSAFEKDLLSYFEVYGGDLQALRDQVALYDWSACKAILIGSVPGYHRGDSKDLWGQARLANVLRNHVSLSEACCKEGSTLALQCSSVALFSQKWFTELGACMGEATNASQAKKPSLRFIYPTASEVSQSAGFLRLEQDVYDKGRQWLDAHLCRWRSDRAGRKKVMPHIKSYARICGSELEWFLLTSANLSRAAWGEFQKNKTQIHVKSYELGVLLCKSLFNDGFDEDIHLLPATVEDRQPVPSNTAVSGNSATVVPIRLPYDIPLIPYTSSDHCYTRHYSHEALENFGLVSED